MKILYLSVHSINEYEDIRMLHDLGHDVISQGAYNDPAHPEDDARPALPQVKYHPDLAPLVKGLDWVKKVSEIPQEVIDWCDLVWILGFEGWLPVNWERMKHRKVVFRSIGQAVEHTEKVLSVYRPQGLKVVRYSPLERLIPGYSGEDALIRFYKDENEWCGWTGEQEQVVTVAQSMKYRNDFLRYDLFEEVTSGLPRALYGSGNEPDEAHPWWKGRVSYEQLKEVYRRNRVFFYTGTRPAQYTMGFMEAWMGGIPVVACGSASLGWPVETPSFIADGVTGFVSDNAHTLRSRCEEMLADHEKARRVGQAGRQAAIRHFGYPMIKEKWRRFLDSW